jgi:3-methylfumaryl-CoA hydratase
VTDIEMKQGSSGRLCFVTISHEIAVKGRLRLIEEQNLVFLEGPDKTAPPRAPQPPPPDSVWTRRVVPTPVQLFRYSALTFNGHRIHYDHPYATGEEGYPGLVVHGPLLALLLLGLGAELRGGPPRTFEYRGLAPIFCDEEIELLADPSSPAPDGEVRLWALHPERGLAMEARIR